MIFEKCFLPLRYALQRNAPQKEEENVGECTLEAPSAELSQHVGVSKNRSNREDLIADQSFKSILRPALIAMR